MKFWQKLFVISIVLFIIIFDLGIYIILNNSYELSQDREMESCIREHDIIKKSINKDIEDRNEIVHDIAYKSDLLSSIIESLADYYESQNVSMALYSKDDDAIFTNIEDFDISMLDSLDKENVIIKKDSEDGKRYMFIISDINDYEKMKYVYARDISEIDDANDESIRLFIVVSVGALLLLGITNYLILRKLTHPINELNKSTKRIAAGKYNERVEYHKTDEFGELAESFNKMSDAVEEKVEGLTEQSRQRQMFIDNLSHEMKTPLTSIIGYSEILQNANVTEEKKALACNYILAAASQLSRLSGELMKLTYFNSCAEEIEFDDFSTSQIADKIKKITSLSLEKKGVTLDIVNELPYINCNMELMVSMLVNLIENAVHASKSGQSIILKFYENDDGRIIEVSDNGCGIEKNQIEKVTEPFYRVDKSRSRANGGVGLGLSLVKKIAEIHKAQFVIESKKENGTSIKILL